MKIYLIRHGETTSDVEDLYGGTFDDHLTEKGQKQAKELANKLLDKEIQIIFSSPYIRAKETSNILKEFLKCDVQMANDTRERNSYGFLSGTSKDKAKKEYPEIYKGLKDCHFTIEGGEKYDDFTNRIRNAFNAVINSDYKRIAIVTHGGPIRCLFRDVLKFGEFEGGIGDCMVVEFEKNDSGFRIINIYGAKLAQK